MLRMEDLLTKDPSRAESNLYLYTTGNPVNFVDPSGYIAEGKEAIDADKIVKELRIYNVFVEVDWGARYSDSWYNDPAI